MAMLRSDEIRKMTPQERWQKLKELRTELLNERGQSAMGGAPVNPGKLRALRKSIARLITIMRLEGDIE